MRKLSLLLAALLVPLALYAGDSAAMPKYSSSNENQVQITISTISGDLSALSISSIATAYTPTSGKKFRLMGGTISVSAAMSVLFEDNAAAARVFRTPKLAADTPYTFVVLQGQGKLSAAANNVLKATGSASGTITGTLDFAEE